MQSGAAQAKSRFARRVALTLHVRVCNCVGHNPDDPPESAWVQRPVTASAQGRPHPGLGPDTSRPRDVKPVRTRFYIVRIKKNIARMMWGMYRDVRIES
jgi:hypothetical protein